MVQDSPHQPVIADLVAMAEHHSGNLRVEQRQRQPAHFLEEDFKILVCRVEHLGDPLIAEKVPQRRKVDAGRQRVNRCGVGAVADLDQA